MTGKIRVVPSSERLSWPALPTTVLAVAVAIVVTLVGTGPAHASSHADTGQPTLDSDLDAALVVEPPFNLLEVGEWTFFRVYRCGLASDGASVRLGKDGRAGTKDDRCRLAQDVQTSLTDTSVARISPTRNRRVKVEALAAGSTSVMAESAGARPSAALISVLPPLPASDPAAIGMRPRGSGDVDGDGRLTDEDVAILAGLLEASEPGVIDRGDSAYLPEGDVIGDALISQGDLRQLRADVARAGRRDRVQRRGEVAITPADIVSLVAGETAVVGAMAGDRRARPLDGAMRVTLLGRNQLYFQGGGEWGATGTLPLLQLWDAHGVEVVTAAEPGSGLLAFVPPIGRPPQVASFEALPAGDTVVLPGADGSLTIPYDVDLDGVLELSDLALAAQSLGTRASDAGFPAAADADADGIISFGDLVPMAHVMVLAGFDPAAGDAGSGDLDGDGDLDHADYRAAVALEQVEIAFDEQMLSRLPADLADRIARSTAAFTDPRRLDMDGDGRVGGDDIELMAAAIGADRESLGPNYRFEEVGPLDP